MLERGIANEELNSPLSLVKPRKKLKLWKVNKFYLESISCAKFRVWGASLEDKQTEQPLL
jgi:hypothetical protein